MRYEILEQFFGQNVEVALVSRSALTGILGPCESDGGWCDTVELEPITDYGKKRHGSWVVDKEMIIAVRPIKPHVDEDDGDCKAECDASS